MDEITAEEIGEYKAAFNHFDKSETGKLSTGEPCLARVAAAF